MSATVPLLLTIDLGFSRHIVFACVVPVRTSRILKVPPTCPISDSTHCLIGSAFTPHNCLQLLALFVCAWYTWCAVCVVPVRTSEVLRVPPTCPISDSTHRLVGSTFTPHICLQLLAWFVCAWYTWCALSPLSSVHCRRRAGLGALPASPSTPVRVLGFRVPVWVRGRIGVGVLFRKYGWVYV